MLTNGAVFNLRVRLEDADGNVGYGFYEGFRIVKNEVQTVQRVCCLNLSLTFDLQKGYVLKIGFFVGSRQKGQK